MHFEEYSKENKVKIKPKTLRQLREQERDFLDESREVWLTHTKYVTDCYYNADKAVIKIIDAATHRVIVDVSMNKLKIGNSKIIPMLESTYRVKIKQEDFYVFRRELNTATAANRTFLL